MEGELIQRFGFQTVGLAKCVAHVCMACVLRAICVFGGMTIVDVEVGREVCGVATARGIWPTGP